MAQARSMVLKLYLLRPPGGCQSVRFRVFTLLGWRGRKTVHDKREANPADARTSLMIRYQH